jgi:hypothetical protein
MLAEDLLPLLAEVTYPAADDRVDHDLFARAPAAGVALGDNTGTVGADHARGLDPLETVRQPEIEVIEGGGADLDSDHALFGLGSRTLPDPDSRRSAGLLPHGRTPLARDLHPLV